MFKVTAVRNGYYGGKIRVPGEVFGIEAVEDFSINWMDTDEGKVLSHVREKSKEKADRETVPVVRDAFTDEAAAVKARADQHKRWLDAKKKGDEPEDAGVETRRVNTGGTDGVVGAEIPVAGAKPTAKEKRALAAAATGKKDVSGAEADAALAAIAATGGSDNDDRSRDAAIDQTASGGSPDWEKPVQADD